MESYSQAFNNLDPLIREFIYRNQWEELRDIQEAAIPAILTGEDDLIIAAATSSGKTEAAFYPAITVLRQDSALGLILYVSPLKALINDQFERLERLCESLQIPVWPWHGDIPSSSKKRFFNRPEGVLLITPESLEAMFCLRGHQIADIFNAIKFVIIDEIHVFLDSERGKQLQSQLHRMELSLERRVTRIGLSATIGDLTLAADYIRPGNPKAVKIIESKMPGPKLQLLIKGYEESLSRPKKTQNPPEDDEEERNLQVMRSICEDLFSKLYESNNLVFANSRNQVEIIAERLNRLCSDARLPNHFWPHHGNLSKEIRSETERALKQNDQPATAISTSTLELGIDIGAVKSVAQIGAPPKVSSLRQRLGRSGRRGDAAIWRGYTIEFALDSHPDFERDLRLSTIKMIAMVELLLENWNEPPPNNRLHLSTLVQQILSLIAERGGIMAHQIYKGLCHPACPFAAVSQEDLILLLREMGIKELITQDSSGLLLLGLKGEKIVNHYSFYAAFATSDDYRVMDGSRFLGTMPVADTMRINDRFLFAGKPWRILEINDDKKILFVVQDRSGNPVFTGDGGQTHSRVRQRMKQILSSNQEILYLNQTAQGFLAEARDSYRRLNLDYRVFTNEGSSALIFTWLGDSTNLALACELSARGFFAEKNQIGVFVKLANGQTLSDVIRIMGIIANSETLSVPQLLEQNKALIREKWDWALPRSLLQNGFASHYLNRPEAREWLKMILAQNEDLIDQSPVLRLEVDPPPPPSR
ncbi:MAG: DEAD/DEAH box helicase [Candidatus Pacebacteria bacterium]|nr:DEAD/DEAH box helicase [Candidatus Paceibacterota bacterium]